MSLIHTLRRHVINRFRLKRWSTTLLLFLILIIATVLLVSWLPSTVSSNYYQEALERKEANLRRINPKFGPVDYNLDKPQLQKDDEETGRQRSVGDGPWLHKYGDRSVSSLLSSALCWYICTLLIHLYIFLIHLYFTDTPMTDMPGSMKTIPWVTMNQVPFVQRIVQGMRVKSSMLRMRRMLIWMQFMRWKLSMEWMLLPLIGFQWIEAFLIWGNDSLTNWLIS